MSTLHELATPALLLDLDRLEVNLDRMAAKADRLGVRLRPHIKTHKSLEVGRMQKERGSRGITVATLHEATIFAADHFDDITWAFPLVLNRIGEARGLAGRITLRLTVDSREAIEALEADGFPFHVWLKVDCGYHRAGVDPQAESTLEIARLLFESKRLQFDGLLTHAGHSYAARSRGAVRAVAEQERDVLVQLAESLRQHGVEVPSLSVGSTPGMSAVENLTGIDEARPGNYVFYDGTQVALGSCSEEDCAVTVLASVVSRQSTHSVVDAGALSLSKDPGPSWATESGLGRCFADSPDPRPDPELRLTSLSQEHGIVNRSLPVGRRVRILPNHSCLTVACFDEYVVVRGEQVVDRWRIHRGRS